MLNMHSVQISDGDTPFAEAVENNGRPPLLLVHGFLASSALWANNIALLSEFSRPISVEQFGHARSTSPPEAEQYSVSYFCGCMDKIRQQLGYAQWSICGHSLGGALMLNYALQYPDTIERVIFTNSRSALQAPTDPMVTDGSEDVIRLVEEEGLEALRHSPYFPSKMRGIPADQKAKLVADAETANAAGIASLMRHMMRDINVYDRFHQIEPPVLLVNGKYERGFQPIRYWAEDILPSLKVVDLDCGHSPNAEQPEQFNQALRDFFTS